MTHSQDSTSPPTDDPRGIVDPNLVAAFRKLSTLKADYETKLLDYMEDCLLPVLNAWRVAGGVERGLIGRHEGRRPRQAGEGHP